ncbi:hypothetical protein BD410DRAFT_732853, partial [Rickenella mellea]
MSSDHANFANLTTIAPRSIKAADGRTFEAKAMGDLRVELPNGDETTKVTLKDTLYAPGIPFTLVSVSRLDHANYALGIKDRLCEI